MWWLSFADGSLPEGSQFLGAVIVRAKTFLEAVKVAHILEINPGGECVGKQIPEDVVVAEEWIERLLDRSECERFQKERESTDGKN